MAQVHQKEIQGIGEFLSQRKQVREPHYVEIQDNFQTRLSCISEDIGSFDLAQLAFSNVVNQMCSAIFLAT